MKYLDEFRAPEKVQSCLAEIARLLKGREARIMEVCGTHTVALFRSGLKKLLPKGLKLLSGPGCPVCVTPNSYLDRAIALSRLPGVTVTTFGDMFRVPGSSSSLEREKASGADIRMVYSPADAVELARQDPSRKFVFLGVGFETTIPGVASSVLHARSLGLRNFHVLCGHKLVPPALRALAQDKETAVQGLLLPGHVCTVIGSTPCRFLAEEFHIPSVVTGFEPLDLAKGIAMLARQIAEGSAHIEIQYGRSVKPEGNPKAVSVMDSVFRPCASVWRGIGGIPGSGLEFRPEFSAFDAARIPAEVEPERSNPGCLCGSVLKGTRTPADCPLFGAACTPEDPVGACMVSSEGTCAAHYRYGRES
ncbi:MAG: hydrogenase formation protein HypD [Elusimicrobiota bacterium]